MWSTYTQIFSINTANVFPLLYECLSNIFFDLTLLQEYSNVLHITYKMCQLIGYVIGKASSQQ